MPISAGGTKYNDEDLDSLFKAIGFIVVQWGQSEQLLDLIVAMTYQKLGGKKIQKRLPKMLAHKLEFLEKCFSSMPLLAPFKAEGKALLDDFDRLGKKRHDLIHGAIAHVSPHNGAFVFAKLDFENNVHRLREVRLELSEFPAFTKELIELGTNAASLGQRILELVSK